MCTVAPYHFEPHPTPRRGCRLTAFWAIVALSPIARMVKWDLVCAVAADDCRPWMGIGYHADIVDS